MTGSQDHLAALADALAGRYALERGGMATVYLTRDLKHDWPVALKVMHPEPGLRLPLLGSNQDSPDPEGPQ